MRKRRIGYAAWLLLAACLCRLQGVLFFLRSGLKLRVQRGELLFQRRLP